MERNNCVGVGKDSRGSRACKGYRAFRVAKELRAPRVARDGKASRDCKGFRACREFKEPKEAKRLLTAVCQLHEYWNIDHVSDEDEAKLETLEQYEARMGFSVENRGIAP